MEQKGLLYVYDRGCGNDVKVKNMKTSQKKSVFPVKGGLDYAA